MSAGATRAGVPAAANGSGTNPWLIAVLVAVAVFMEVLDTTIANVALRYIAGGLGVSEDEASWVGRRRLVRHGHLPEREIVTGIGAVAVRCPRVRDRVGEGGEHIRLAPSGGFPRPVIYQGLSRH